MVIWYIKYFRNVSYLLAFSFGICSQQIMVRHGLYIQSIVGEVISFWLLGNWILLSLVEFIIFRDY